MNAPHDKPLSAFDAPMNRALVLAAVTVLVYLPGLAAPFIYDDFAHLVRRGEIQKLWPIKPIVDDGRPVGFLSFALNHAVSGMHPAGFRAVNIAIHLATGLLLMSVIARTLEGAGSPSRFSKHAAGIAFSAALLFLVHPLATGGVTYIIQRFESLAACFCLLALYALVVGASSSNTRRWYALVVLAGWLAMLTKQTAAVLPLVALFYDRAFLAPSWREVFSRRGIMHVGLMAGWAALYLTDALRQTGVDAGSAGLGAGITPWEYLRSQPRSLARYLQLTVWPDALIFDYGWKVVDEPWLIYGLGAMIVTLLTVSIAAWFVRPRLGFLGLATFAALAPSSSILPIADLAVEYRMYLPLIPLLTLVTVVAWELIGRWIADENLQRKVAFGLLLAATLPLGGRTALRNFEYRDPLRIWRQSADFNSDNGRANYNTAGRLGAARLEEGTPYFEAALASDFWDQAAVHTTFADYLAQVGRRDDAVIHYRQALKILPRDTPVRIKLAELYAKLGDRDAAHEEIETALKLDPQNAAASALRTRLEAENAAD